MLVVDTSRVFLKSGWCVKDMNKGSSDHDLKMEMYEFATTLNVLIVH